MMWYKEWWRDTAPPQYDEFAHTDRHTDRHKYRWHIAYCLNFPSLPTYLISSKALRARLSSSFINSKSLTRANFRSSFRTRKIMSSTWTRPVRPISIALQKHSINWNHIRFFEIANESVKKPLATHLCVVSVMNSITKSSRKSTLSVYGFWSSPYPYIIHRNSLLNKRLRPLEVEPRLGSNSPSSSNCIRKSSMNVSIFDFHNKNTIASYLVLTSWSGFSGFSAFSVSATSSSSFIGSDIFLFFYLIK